MIFYTILQAGPNSNIYQGHMIINNHRQLSNIARFLLLYTSISNGVISVVAKTEYKYDSNEFVKSVRRTSPMTLGEIKTLLVKCWIQAISTSFPLNRIIYLF